MFVLNSLGLLLCLVSAVRSAWSPEALIDGLDCVSGPSSWYYGTLSVTRDGTECQMWGEQSSDEPSLIPYDGPHHNYCRNPDNDANGYWCYNADQQRSYCNVPACPDDAKIIWVDIRNNSASILSMKADPNEIRKQFQHVRQHFDVSVLADSDHKHSKFVDVTGSYSERTIFFADSNENCIVVKNVEIDMMSRHLYGLAKGVRAMAYDWVRQNLYWTDALMKWVMVADVTLSYYTPIYSSNDQTPHALTLHAVQQKLFFSVYESSRSKIYVTDLAGGNPRVLFNSTQVRDVISMAVDCTDNRLYFTDNLGHGSMVMSSNLDGTDLRRNFFRRIATFTGISAYSDYIFVTDATKRLNAQGVEVGTMWVKNKSDWRFSRVEFEGEPGGMKVLSQKEEDSIDMTFDSDDCFTPPYCSHICIPRSGGARQCVCSSGYSKVGDTGCQIASQSDSFLLVVDEDQRKVFQASLDTPSDVSLVDIENVTKVAIVSLDPVGGSMYVSGRGDSITKLTLTGQDVDHYQLPIGSKVNSIAVDPQTGNVFYTDILTHAIYVINRHGNVTREIMTSDLSYTNDIKSIALDLQNKKVYWTNTNSLEGQGQVMRMNMDGSDFEIILSDLHWHEGIAIDYARNSLFVSDSDEYFVHEFPLDPRENVTEILHQLTTSSQRNENVNIRDIAVHEGALYLLNNHMVEKADLETGVITEHTTAQFYKPSSIAVYDQTIRQQISTFPDPCLALPGCRTICLATSPQSAVCVV